MKVFSSLALVASVSALTGYDKEGDRCYVHMSDSEEQSSTCNFKNAACCYIWNIELEKMMNTKLCVNITKKTVTRVYPPAKDGSEYDPEVFE